MEPFSQSKAAASRHRYLEVLKTLQNSGPAEIYLRDDAPPKKVSSIKCIHPESNDILVTDLETALGVIPAAVVRGTDVRHLKVQIGDKEGGNDDNSTAKADASGN